MSDITEIAVRNVRCFDGRHKVRVPRITLLVGDNSAGKSAFLACCHALSSIVHTPEHDYDPFNRGPFPHSTFADLARNGGTSFGLGGRVGTLDYSIEFVQGLNGHPTERLVTVGNDDIGTIRLERRKNGRGWRMAGPNFEFDFEKEEFSFTELSVWLGLSVREGHLPFNGAAVSVEPGAKREQFVRLCNFLGKLSALLRFPRSAVHAVPPDDRIMGGLRYDRHPLFPGFAGDSDVADGLLDGVRVAGEKLGLFSGVHVSPQSDLYRLEVRVQKRFRDVAHVGLGVRCILPFLARFVEHPGRAFLLQQPETHLHPSAEAELAQLLAESPNRFVVETHSEFVLMRLQTCVRKGTLRPSEVGILWFEVLPSRARIHEIGMDDAGNIIDPPAGYRKFFTRETHDFLGLG